MNRRRFLTTSATAALGTAFWPGVARAAENGQGGSGWTFLAVNDLHYHDKACGPWFEKVVQAMKASAPQAEFCLLGGDQANDARLDQMGPVREIFRGLGVPLYSTIGNHDWTADGSRKAYDDIFPKQDNQVFEHRDWQLIGLDSSDGLKASQTTIHASTFQWLDAALPKLSKEKPTILFTHFPLGEFLIYRPLNADDLLARFTDYNLRAVFNGHFHSLTERVWHNATVTTDRCCSRFRKNHDFSPQKGWFVCHAEEGKIRREFVEIPPELRTA